MIVPVTAMNAAATPRHQRPALKISAGNETVKKRLLEKGLNLEMTDEAKELIISKGSNKEYGARPLRRAIDHLLEDPLAEELLFGRLTKGGLVRLDVKDDKIVFEYPEVKPPKVDMPKTPEPEFVE